MTKAKTGDTVNVHYTGKFDDGEVFDSSVERDPLKFTLGEGKVIPGFEKAVIGMSPGESTIAKIPHAEAYGPRMEELILSVDKSKFPENFEPQVGQCLDVRRDDGQIMSVVVTEVSEQAITLDANHPLAGKDLNFDIELVEILE
jgi:peptidylprolyl isomerase